MNRVYNKFKIPFTNLYLIQWMPRVVTPIHGHSNECNFLLLKGKLQENVYKNLQSEGYYMISSNIISPHQSSHINNTKGFHSIKNMSDNYSWSLHYYN
jgi:predicted metal-dependent enzyme (double-stranded beta helix superfamily)